MNPLKLTFTANEQTLTKTDNFIDFASNTVSYIEATFTLGENWTGYDSVRAVWKTDYYTISTVLDANFTCVVPTEVLRYKAKVFVNLVGSIVENDTLTDRLTTFPVLALTVKANAAVNGSETAPVTASQFEQFVDTVRNEAESISDYSYDSEAWAVGTRGGVDVPSTDPTYHNNSKYWAEENAGLADDVADLKSDNDYYADQVVGYPLPTKPIVEMSDLEQGTLTSTGLNSDDETYYLYRVRSKDYFKLIPNEEYTVRLGKDSLQWSVSFYNANDFETARVSNTIYQNSGTTFTCPSNCYYGRLLIKHSAGSQVLVSDIKSVLISNGEEIPSPDMTVFEQIAKIEKEIGASLVDKSDIEQGALNGYGLNNDDAQYYSYRLRSSGYFPLEPNRQYKAVISGNNNLQWSVSFYNANDFTTHRISNIAYQTGVATFTCPNNCMYGRLLITSETGSVISPSDITRIYMVLADDYDSLTERVVNLETKILANGNNYVISGDLIKRYVNANYLGQLTYLQAFCRYNNKYYSINGTDIAEQDSSFNVLQNVTLNTAHGNGLQLGNGKYAYASGWNDNNIYKVDLEELTIADTITLPTTGYTTGVVDEVKNFAYIFQRDSYPDAEDNYNFIVYDLTNQQIVSTKKILAFGAMQAADFFNDRIIVLNGLGNSTCPNGCRVFDINGNIIADYYFGDFSTIEPEGVCIDRDTHELYISFVDRKCYKIDL